MCDAVCRKCRKRFGWPGEPKDCPPCPRCGHRFDAAALAHDQAELERGREMLFADNPETKSGLAEPVWVQDWLPEAIVYVGRKHPAFPGHGLYGNPFSHSGRSTALLVVATVEEAVECYRRWLAGDEGIAASLPESQEARRLRIVANLPYLRGKRLACWRHDGPCHAQVLAEMANGLTGA